MKPATKLALRRFALRWLRKLVDVADEELHIAEVKLRDELAKTNSSDGQGFATIAEMVVGETFLSAQDKASNCPTATDETAQETPIRGTNFAQWEARRSGITPKVKIHRARRRTSASDFDFQIIRKREEFIQ